MSPTADFEAEKRPDGPSRPLSPESDIHLWHDPPQPTDKFSYDRDNKYPEDPIGRELGENARVWRHYRDEVTKYDEGRIGRWNDTIDVLLVFSGLFSAILTAFLAQTSTYLSPNYQEINARMSIEMLIRQNGGVPATGAASVTDLAAFKPRTIDVWINALWFTSLAQSLAVAFCCVLFRQWLQHYTSGTTQTLRTEAFIRQSRIIAMKQWQVPFLIGLLPQALNSALLLFLIGLNVFLWDLNSVIGALVFIISFAVCFTNTVTSILPSIYPHCPYVTPLSALLYWCYRVLFPRNPQINNNALETGVPREEEKKKEKRDDILKLSPEALFRRRELDYVNKRDHHFCAESLAWLYSENAGNPAIASVVIEALAGVQAKPSGHQILRKDFIGVDVEVLKGHGMEKHAVKVLKQHAMSSSTLRGAKMILEGKGEDNVSKRLWKGCQTLGEDSSKEKIRTTWESLANLESNMEKMKKGVWAAVVAGGIESAAMKRASLPESV